MEQNICQSCGMPLSDAILNEVNALNLPELHLTELFELPGAFVNQAYTINGNEVKLLDDNATYWGNQVERQNGRCYGIACDEHHILVSEYGADGADPELIVFKKQ